jgi:hypothetical protein
MVKFDCNKKTRINCKTFVMKKLNSFIYLTCLLFFIVAISGCSAIPTNDPCDDTAKPEIEVSIKAIIHVLDKDKKPIPNQQVNLYLYKEPCGADIKGKMEFSGPTDEQGIRSTSTAYYNLRNLEDMVWVDVYAVNLGNGSATADSEYVTYKYNDFIVGTTKEVHIYIYRKF